MLRGALLPAHHIAATTKHTTFPTTAGPRSTVLKMVTHMLHTYTYYTQRNPGCHARTSSLFVRNLRRVTRGVDSAAVVFGACVTACTRLQLDDVCSRGEAAAAAVAVRLPAGEIAGSTLDSLVTVRPCRRSRTCSFHRRSNSAAACCGALFGGAAGCDPVTERAPPTPGLQPSLEPSPAASRVAGAPMEGAVMLGRRVRCVDVLLRWLTPAVLCSPSRPAPA